MVRNVNTGASITRAERMTVLKTLPTGPYKSGLRKVLRDETKHERQAKREASRLSARENEKLFQEMTAMMPDDAPSVYLTMPLDLGAGARVRNVPIGHKRSIISHPAGAKWHEHIAGYGSVVVRTVDGYELLIKDIISDHAMLTQPILRQMPELPVHGCAPKPPLPIELGCLPYELPRLRPCIAFGNEAPPFGPEVDDYLLKSYHRMWYFGTVEHGPEIPVTQIKTTNWKDRQFFLNRDGWLQWLQRRFSDYNSLVSKLWEIEHQYWTNAFVEAKECILNAVVVRQGDWLYSRVGPLSVVRPTHFVYGGMDLGKVQCLRGQSGVFLLGPVAVVQENGMTYQVRRVISGVTRPYRNLLRFIFIMHGTWVGAMRMEVCLLPRDLQVGIDSLSHIPTARLRARLLMLLVSSTLPEHLRGPYMDIRPDISSMKEEDILALDVQAMAQELVEADRRLKQSAGSSVMGWSM